MTTAHLQPGQAADVDNPDNVLHILSLVTVGALDTDQLGYKRNNQQLVWQGLAILGMVGN